LSARQHKNLVIPGRTSALAIADLDEAVKRAKAYESAGVDAIFLAGGVTVEAAGVVSSAIKIPLILGGCSGQLGDLDWLAAHRVRVVAAILFPLARARGRVQRCNATAAPASSKTAISAGARRPESPAHRTGDR